MTEPLRILSLSTGAVRLALRASMLALLALCAFSASLPDVIDVAVICYLESGLFCIYDTSFICLQVGFNREYAESSLYSSCICFSLPI